MTKNISNHYLLKQNTSQQWYFYHEPENGICFKKKTEKAWTEFEILLKDGLGDFDVIVDPRDNIHLICQDHGGTILYLMYNGSQWHKYIILRSKATRAYPKYFKMVYLNGWLNLFYVIEYRDKNLLVHQILDNKNVTPNVVDYIEKKQRPFSISCDNSNNIHVYYQSSTAADKIGYRLYIWSQKSWSDFIVIEQPSRLPSLPYAIIDENESIHLIYLNKVDKYYDIIYKRKPSSSYDKTLWDKEVTVYNRCQEDEIPIILKAGGKLHIMWKSDLKVFCSTSEDDGITWNRPTQFMAGRYGDIIPLNCRFSPETGKEALVCDMGYGYVNSEDVILYAASESFQQLSVPKKEPEYKVEGYEVEEFANKNAKAFGIAPSPSAATDLTTLFKNAPAQSSNDMDTSSGNVEITKLRIMLNMMQEEIVQTKKKILELEQTSSRPATLDDGVYEHFGSEITEMRNELAGLSSKIESIVKALDTFTSTDLTRINRELSNLKRKQSSKSFYDLVSKTAE